SFFRTSVGMTLAAPRVARAVCSKSEALRAARATFAPISASSRAIARPIPRPAPVTTATFPSMLVIRLVSGNRDFLILVLELIKLVVQPALGKKFLMRTHFAHAAFVHHQDLIALLNSGKAVRDHD